MKIRTKILGGFMIVALVGVIIGVVAFVSSRMLSGVATEMHNVQLEGASISNVLNAHYLWRQGITEAALNGTDFTGSLDPETCALGQWRISEDARKMEDPELIQMLSDLSAPHELIHTEAQTVVDLISSGEAAQARQYLNSEILPATEEVIGILTDMQARYSVLTAEIETESTRINSLVTVINIVLIAAAVVVGVFFAIFISNLVSRPLSPLTAFMTQVGTTGDISLSPDKLEQLQTYGKSKDEIGQTIAAASSFFGRIDVISGALETIANGDLTVELSPLSDRDALGLSLQKMTGNLNAMFTNINSSAEQVSSGAGQVADGSQALAQGSTEQAASIEELSGSISEIAERTKANAVKAEQAAQLAGTIKGSAEKGSRQMDQMMEAVRDINQSSHDISKVIKVIDDIAFQTNILALNAAVEAARAGQHGKGFAVVAEEVRNLAAKSAEAASSTESLILNSTGMAELGVRIAEETAASLSEIVSGINESSQLVGEIALSSEEQSSAILQINSGIDQVATVVQQNSATAQESAAASQEMNSQSVMLRELISKFRLKGGPHTAGLPMHGSAARLPAYADGGDYAKY